jgi:multicomponent K+:H+ antiporter subunit D
MAAVGLPPLSGFVGKLAILDSVRSAASGPLAWTVILIASLVMLAGYARAGSTLFWNVGEAGDQRCHGRIAVAPVSVVAALIGLTAVMSVFGGQVMAILEATALEMADPASYTGAVLPKVVSQVP